MEKKHHGNRQEWQHIKRWMSLTLLCFLFAYGTIFRSSAFFCRLACMFLFKKTLILFCFSAQYIKIPAPTADSPSALRVFSFYLSSDSKDQPQASFDCIHQYVSRYGVNKLITGHFLGFLMYFYGFVLKGNSSAIWFMSSKKFCTKLYFCSWHAIPSQAPGKIM